LTTRRHSWQHISSSLLHEKNITKMPVICTHDAQHAKMSYEQKKAARQRREAFLADVKTSRVALLDTINQMSEKHNKYEINILRCTDLLTLSYPRNSKVVATQLYAGTKMLLSSRKPSLFNAIQHCTANERRDAGESKSEPGNRGTILSFTHRTK